MKICLVIPPSVFLLDERVFMTLGILKVAAVLEETGIQVDLMDLSGILNYEKVVKDYCSNNEMMVFGITATTPQLPATMNILKAIKNRRPLAKVILGGPHITLTNAARKREQETKINNRAIKAFDRLSKDFDILVAGDGEDAIFEAIKKDCPNLVDADDPKSNLFLSSNRLTSLPFPARHLVDVDSYRYEIDKVRALSIIAQLGCPFECGFCGGRASPFLRRVRTRDSHSIIAEMRHLYETYDVRGFMMYDDELNVNRKMIELMKSIANLQRDLKIDFRLRGFIKSELFTEEQAEAMYAAGFRWILVGFESGSPRMLKNMNKKVTREENTRCLEIAKKHGLKVKALMSLGHPGESEETVAETVDWLLKNKPNDFDITIITTYPGTSYYDLATPSEEPDTWVYIYKKTGDRLYSIEIDYRFTSDYYKGDPDGGYQSFVFTDYLTREQLVDLRNETEAEVRKELGIPFNPTSPAVKYEHSMGQCLLPKYILRSTSDIK